MRKVFYGRSFDHYSRRWKNSSLGCASLPVICGDKQHLHTPGNFPLTIFVNHLHLWLLLWLTDMPLSEVLWRLLHCWKFEGQVRLDWSENTEALYRKGLSRLFFLRRIRSLDVCTRLLRMFYQCLAASVIFFAAVCWGGGIRSGGAIKLNKLVRKASSVVGVKMDSMEVVTERRKRVKLQAIMDNPSFKLRLRPSLLSFKL